MDGEGGRRGGGVRAVGKQGGTSGASIDVRERAKGERLFHHAASRGRQERKEKGCLALTERKQPFSFRSCPNVRAAYSPKRLIPLFSRAATVARCWLDSVTWATEAACCSTTALTSSEVEAFSSALARTPSSSRVRAATSPR